MSFLNSDVVDVVESHWNFDALEKAANFARHHHRLVETRIEPQIHRVSHRLSAQDRQGIVDLYLTGASSREVGARFNIAKGTVINLVRQAGHQPH